MGAPFGKYQLIASLGRGGMADVYLAAMSGPVGFRKLVVIKRLREDVGDRMHLTSMLLDEAQLAARLQHANVVQTFEVGVHEGQHYIAMEYLEGQPIARIIRVGGRPNHAFSARVMADALAGLEYAHTLTDYDGRPLSIVHRDVSPQNLFVTYGGEVKVVDFGVAKTALRVSTEETETGVLKGKFGYMAPEQINDGAVDRRTDVYAAGVVFWELLTGKRLFKMESGDGPTQAIARMLFQPIAPPRELVPELPPELDAICLRALAREPRERWQSAGEMREALYRFMESPGGSFRRDDVGAYVTSLFAREREEIRQRITEFMEEAEDSPPRDAKSLRTLRASSIAASIRPSAAHAEPSAPTISDAETQLRTPPPAEGAALSSSSFALWWRLGITGITAVIGLAIAAVFELRSSGTAPAPDAASAVEAGAPALTPVLTLEGSGTIGVEASPALLEGFLRKRGATAVRREKGPRPDDVVVVATTATGATESYLVKNEGTQGGFQCLAERSCDIAMAAREIREPEATAMIAKGMSDPRSPATEHVIALDGIAVIVNPANTVRALERAQIAKIFTGEVTDWSAVGGPSGPITIAAHEDGSGTYDIFDAIVLGGRPLVGTAKRMADNVAIAESVSAQPSAVGFVSLAFVRGTKALAVSDRGAVPMLPSAFTVSTERYLLTRRFYLYNAVPPKPLVVDFLDYVASEAAQQEIRNAGFIDLELSLKNTEPCDHCPPKYARETRKGRRLSVDFRFRPGTHQLDARAAGDIGRVVRFLRDHRIERVMLFGFADASGDAKGDLKRSRELAQAIDAELGTRGVRASVVEGLGGEMPVASNATDWGKGKNRRVEIWVVEDR